MDLYFRQFLQKESEESFKCEVCHDTLSNAGLLVDHLASHLTSSLFTCLEDKCPAMTTDYKKIVQHLRDTNMEHVIKYTCLKCNDMDKNFKKHLLHVRIHMLCEAPKFQRFEKQVWPSLADKHDKKAFQRAEQRAAKNAADKAYKNELLCVETNSEPKAGKYDFVYHVLQYDTSPREVKCRVCCSMIPTPLFYIHMRDHLQNTSYVCCRCNLDWLQHKHRRPEEKNVLHQFKFYCHLCRIWHPSIAAHLSHVKFHFVMKNTLDCQMTLFKKHACDCVVCHSQFFNHTCLLNHLMEHFTSVIFYCRVCFENFGNDCKSAIGHLKVHDVLLRARNSIVYLCLYCGAQENFVDHRNCSDHIALHLQEREESSIKQQKPTFQCKMITSSLSEFRNCQLTFKRHTGSCEAEFTDPNLLFEHVRNHAVLNAAEPTTGNSQNRASHFLTDTEGVPVFNKISLNNSLKRGGSLPKSCSTIHEDVLNLPPSKSARITVPDEPGTSGTYLEPVKQEIIGIIRPEKQESPGMSCRTLKKTNSGTQDQPLKQQSTEELSIKRKIIIFKCKQCNKRFIEEHFYRQHLEKAGH